MLLITNWREKIKLSVSHPVAGDWLCSHQSSGYKGRFRCKKFGYFTKTVKNITNGVFIYSKQINNDTKKQ